MYTCTSHHIDQIDNYTIQNSAIEIIFQLVGVGIFNSDIITSDIFTSDIFTSDIITSDIFTSDIFTSDIFTSDIITSDIFTFGHLGTKFRLMVHYKV